jgi:16S rRNA (cytosine1402-N4)-methyltransferase
MGSSYHKPVLLKEVINGLDKCCRGQNGKGKVVVDATAGGMGHSSALAQKLCDSGILVCIDQDKEALEANKEDLAANSGCKIEFVHDNFMNITKILEGLNIDKTDAVLADLGVSSRQIDNADRGFSYTKDAPLDMRMDTGQKRDAYHVVNNYRPERLKEIIENYGEERYAERIAGAILAARPIKTTLELVKVITGAVPNSYYKTGGHPAKRTFQALRIEVNRELEVLEKFITDAVKSLSIGGRIAIITFHSLEDRIVKKLFKFLSTDCICPPKTPKCICNHKATLKIVTKKPIIPQEAEMNENPRSKSAKLRIAEKI